MACEYQNCWNIVWLFIILCSATLLYWAHLICLCLAMIV